MFAHFSLSIILPVAFFITRRGLSTALLLRAESLETGTVWGQHTMPRRQKIHESLPRIPQHPPFSPTLIYPRGLFPYLSVYVLARATYLLRSSLSPDIPIFTLLHAPSLSSVRFGFSRRVEAQHQRERPPCDSRPLEFLWNLRAAAVPPLWQNSPTI